MCGLVKAIPSGHPRAYPQQCRTSTPCAMAHRRRRAAQAGCERGSAPATVRLLGLGPIRRLGSFGADLQRALLSASGVDWPTCTGRWLGAFSRL